MFKDVVSALTTIVERVFQVDEWWEECGKVAKQLTRSKLNDLLGAMVHAPPMPQYLHYTPWDWLRKFQLAR